MRSIGLIGRRPGAFPFGRSPGVDRSHIAFSSGHGLNASVIALNGNFVRVDAPGLGTITGSLARGLDPIAGPLVVSATRLGSQKSQFTGVGCSTIGTIACIFKQTVATSTATGDVILGLGGSTNYTGLQTIASTGVLQVHLANNNNTIGILPALNTPYFFAASFFTGGTLPFVWVLKNLLTGQVFSGSAAVASQPLNTTTLTLFNTTTTTQSLGGGIAAAAVLSGGPSRLSQAALVAWAADPWSFWYPEAGSLGIIGGLALPPVVRVDQQYVEVIGAGAPGLVQIDQQYVEVVGAGAPGLVQVDQQYVEVIGSDALGVFPSAFADGETIGQPLVVPGPVAISPTGIAGAETIGAPAVGLVIAPTGFADGETIGQPLVARPVVVPTGFVDGETIGAPAVKFVISPTGIAGAEAIGQPAVAPGPVTIDPTGFAGGETIGQPLVAEAAPPILPTGFVDGETIGAPAVKFVISPTGIAGAAAIGQPLVAPGPVAIHPTGFAGGETIGRPLVAPGPVWIYPLGWIDGEAFGLPLVQLLKVKGRGGGHKAGGVNKGQKYATQVVLDDAGLIIALEMQSSITKAVNTRMALYSDNAGKPDRLLAVSSVQTSVVAGANRYPLQTPYSVAAGVPLWPALQSDGNFTWFLTDGVGASDYNADAFADGIADPFGPATAQANQAPVFVVYLQTVALTIPPTGFVTGETFGRPALANVLPQTITPAGFVDGGAIGAPAITVASATIKPTAIAGSAAVGLPSIRQAQRVLPAGFADLELVGSPSLAVEPLPDFDPANVLGYRRRPRRDLDYAAAPTRDLDYARRPGRDLDYDEAPIRDLFAKAPTRDLKG